MSNGSGDYAVAFSTAETVRRTPERRRHASPVEDLANDRMSPLFLAVVEATEEAIYNAMFRATTMSGHRGQTLHALPLDRVLESLRRHQLLVRPETAPAHRRPCGGAASSSVPASATAGSRAVCS